MHVDSLASSLVHGYAQKIKVKDARSVYFIYLR